MNAKKPNEGDNNDDFEVDCNPTGPWAQLENPDVKMVILNATARFHGRVAAVNPTLTEFRDFLDVYTTEWLKLKGAVESEASKFGFRECESTAEVAQSDRPKVAVLALTISGSYLLLGNGCLSSAGGSGHYQKISFRTHNSVPVQSKVPGGVQCKSEPTIKEELELKNNVEFGIGRTSPLQLLYYTTDQLSADDALRVSEVVSEQLKKMTDETVQFRNDETVPVEVETPQKEEFPLDEPVEI